MNFCKIEQTQYTYIFLIALYSNVGYCILWICIYWYHLCLSKYCMIFLSYHFKCKFTCINKPTLKWIGNKPPTDDNLFWQLFQAIIIRLLYFLNCFWSSTQNFICRFSLCVCLGSNFRYMISRTRQQYKLSHIQIQNMCIQENVCAQLLELYIHTKRKRYYKNYFCT